MSTYIKEITKQISQLVELQKIDDEIFAVKNELVQAPRELEELERHFAQVEARREKILDNLRHIQEQQKRLSMEIDDDSARIEKSRNKLNQVGRTREYTAVMREMDSMEKLNREREQEKIRVMEELQAQNDELAKVDIDYTAAKAELEVKRDSLQDRLDTATAKLARLQDVRSNTGDAIPQPVFTRYEFIRLRLEHPVIVSVSDGICSGCHIAIPPQTFIELQQGQQILSCPNCQRLIYWKDNFQEEEPQAPARPEPLHD